MRILLLVDAYYPNPRSVARMMRDLGMEFVRRGHEVTVVTPGGETGWRLRVSREDGMEVVRVKAGTLKNVNRAIRGWRESRLSATLWRRAKHIFQQTPCGLIVYYSPSIFFGALVKKLKQLWRCPAYLVLRDIFPKWALDAGVLKKGMVYGFFRRKELLQYSAADVIGVEAPGNLHYFHDQLADKEYSLEVLLNWADPKAQPLPSITRRQKLGLTGKVVFFYGGNIGVAQDMDNILRLAKSLIAHEQIAFLLVGSGSEVARVKTQVEKQRLQNVMILPPVSQNDYLRFLSEFDVGLVSLDRRLETNSLTGKLLGYMACGMPILASVNPGNDLVGLLREADAGIACENGDDERLRAAAILLADNPALRQRLGENSRKLLESKFSVRAAAAQILGHFPEAGMAALGQPQPSRMALEGNAIQNS